MKKQIIIPLVTAILGITIGYFLFSSTAVEVEDHSDHQAKDEVWTCSMDPQIRSPEPGDCPICGMDLIPADAAGSGDPLVFEMTEDAIRIANIQTTVIGSGSQNTGTLSLSGKIEVDETVASSVVTHIPGRIEKLYVSFTGDKVYKGQKIASIYSPNLITAQRELLEADKLKDNSPYLLEAAKNKLRYWKITDKEISAILKSGKIKEYFDIRSDHSGVIRKKRVSVGDHLGQGGTLFDLQNLNQLWAIFNVYEADLNQVSVGKMVTFTTSAFTGEEFSAPISFIDPFIDPMTRTASVRLKISNPKNRLKPEMFITGHLQQSATTEKVEKLMVPKTAVLWTGERSIVYVKLPDLEIPSFEFREVQIGPAIGLEYEVIDGLASGDEVVTNGAFVIDASAQLNNQMSMMNRNLLSGTLPEPALPSAPDYATGTSEKFQEQLGKLVTTYFALKNNLGDDNLKATKQKSKQFTTQLNAVDMTLVKGDAHLFWMKEMKILETAAKGLSTAENLDNAKTSFQDLSLTLINAIKAFGVNDQEEHYVQFCSMAFDNKGGYWLNENADVRNPYFGGEMLGCGEVKETIK